LIFQHNISRGEQCNLPAPGDMGQIALGNHRHEDKRNVADYRLAWPIQSSIMPQSKLLEP
jgi:hypothetical protein